MRKIFAAIIATAFCLALSSCSGDDSVTLGDINLGELAYDSTDVLGVTYDLYDNGYALIESILHENARIGDAVSYDGKEYAVIGFVYPGGSTGAFGLWDTKSPKELILPNAIQHIPNYALSYCSASEITLPASLKTLGNAVFQECTNIETLDIPDSVTSIGGTYLFQNCRNLKSVSIPEDCDMQFLNGTFEGCTSLEAVTIPGSADYVGRLCFYQCYALKSVTIGDGVERIKDSAFMDCPQLSKIVIPDSITVIEDCAFQGCSGLTDITLSDNMTDVSANLFVNLDRQPIDVSGMTIRVKAEQVPYVQSIYPEATVVEKQ